MTRVILATMALFVLAVATAAQQRPNVLFLCIDDLRPELHCYGRQHMVTPRLDQLAASGRLFRRHYVQLPTCGASRFSMLTGRYPHTRGAFDNGAFGVLKPGDDILTLPEAFRAAGYVTVGLGKISHQPDGRVFGYNGSGAGREEMPDAWDYMSGPVGRWGTAWDSFFGYADGSSRTDRRAARQPAPPAEHADVNDTGYPDGLTTVMAIDRLRGLKRNKNKPFFMAVGFFKPHLPFNAPKKYWDLYDPAKIQLAPYAEAPQGLASKVPLSGSGEFFGYTHPKRARTDADHHRDMRRSYYSAVSYIDTQVGKLLDELERLELAQNTIVIVWGDHGWHLGDQGIWGKHTVFERALQSAFIIRTPNMKAPGVATSALVGSVDIYPTLVDLCSLTAPERLDGESLLPLLDEPNAQGKPQTLGFWNKRGHQGLSMRTDRYRYTEWTKGEGPAQVVELYDLQEDPEGTRNLAGARPKVVAVLHEQMARSRAKLR